MALVVDGRSDEGHVRTAWLQTGESDFRLVYYQSQARAVVVTRGQMALVVQFR